MSPDEILNALQEHFPGAIHEVPELIDPTVVIDVEKLVDIAAFLHDECDLDYLADVTSVDRTERFEVLYHLYSMAHETAEPFVLKVYLEEKQNPSVPSLTSIWQGALFQEAEVYDMMGIHFLGHPDLKRILMWDGFEGYPLRKDFQNRTFTYKEMQRTQPDST